jgi:hypothetical protein
VWLNEGGGLMHWSLGDNWSGVGRHCSLGSVHPSVKEPSLSSLLPSNCSSFSSLLSDRR